MTNTLTPARLVRIFRELPEKTFRIAGLAPQLLDGDGKPDIGKCMLNQGELNLAIAEVRSYVTASKVAVEALRHIGTKTDARELFEEEDIVVGEEDGL